MNSRFKLATLAAQANINLDDIDAHTVQPDPLTGFPLDYIALKTAFYTQLESGRLLDSLTNDDAELSPNIHFADMLATWTLDLGLTPADEREIETLVFEVIQQNFPDGVSL